MCGGEVLAQLYSIGSVSSVFLLELHEEVPTRHTGNYGVLDKRGLLKSMAHGHLGRMGGWCCVDLLPSGLAS